MVLPRPSDARARRTARWALFAWIGGASLLTVASACGSNDHPGDAADSGRTPPARDATASNDAAGDGSDAKAATDADASDGPSLPVKTLRSFGAACDGTTNDRDAVAKAF